jgi:hypothetical protein
VRTTREPPERCQYDPDPLHGRNALCAATLETIAAHRAGSPEADRLVSELTEVFDQGPSSVLPWATLELAWVLEERGDLVAATRVAGYRSADAPEPFAVSTTHREAARLAEAAGDLRAAQHNYRWYLGSRPAPDARFAEQDEVIRARFAELEIALGPGR